MGFGDEFPPQNAGEARGCASLCRRGHCAVARGAILSGVEMGRFNERKWASNQNGDKHINK